MARTFRWSAVHFDQLEEYSTAAGLIDVAANRKRPPPSVFRAFYEHWYALVGQLLPVLESKDMGAGQEARELLLQMKRNAAIDGVYSAHMTKILVGRKPGSNA